MVAASQEEREIAEEREEVSNYKKLQLTRQSKRTTRQGALRLWRRMSNPRPRLSMGIITFFTQGSSTTRIGKDKL